MAWTWTPSLVLVALFWVWLSERRSSPDAGRVWAVLFGLVGGLWFFEVFCCAGWVWWPLGNAAGLREYGFLLYSHVVLELTVGACVLWSACREGLEGRLSWGTARGWPLWVGLGAVLWVWAVCAVTHTRPQVNGPAGLVITIAFSKACLTGFGEEAYYRGLLQRAAVARFGVVLGIGFQACVYAAFHAGLTPAFVSYALFVPGVFALGVVLGVIAHVTRGIGWVSVFHTAIDMVIEWCNIS